MSGCSEPGSSRWRSMSTLASDLGSTTEAIRDALIVLGLVESRAHSREESGERLYDDAIARLVQREIGYLAKV